MPPVCELAQPQKTIVSSVRGCLGGEGLHNAVGADGKQGMELVWAAPILQSPRRVKWQLGQARDGSSFLGAAASPRSERPIGPQPMGHPGYGAL